MGLDAVEFVMGVEEAFQIAIPDHEAEGIRTPRQVVDYVMGRVGTTLDVVCLEQRAFYRLRRSAVRVFGASRREIRPETLWDALLPKRQRRHNWGLLGEASGISPWPGLTVFGNYGAGLATVGGTARFLGGHAAASLKGGEGWTRAQVEETIRQLMSEHLNIREFDWDAEFVRDLGVD